MRKNMIFIMLLLMISSVLAIEGPSFPVYTPVNEYAEIIAGSQEIDIYNVSMTFKGETFYLDYISDIDRYRIYLTSSIEEDIMFTLRGYNNESSFLDLINYDVLNDDEIISDNLIRAFKYNHTESHNETNPETSVICTTVKKKQGTPIIKLVSGYENGSQIVWNENPLNHIIDSVDYQTYCHDTNTVFKIELSNDYFYYGFYCENCDLTNKITLHTENDDLLNNSVYFDDINDSTATDENTMNFGITSSISHIEPVKYFEGELFFREPYNVTINLYKENGTVPGTTSAYCNQLSNVFLLQDDTGIEDIPIDWANEFNKLAFIIDPLNLKDKYVTNTLIDDKVYYNSLYENCQATVTLYEPGNYSVYLVGSKNVIVNKDFGFDTPINNNEQFVSKISTVTFDTKQDYEVKIFTTDWEISKIWVILNIGKWILITVLPILLIFLIKSGVLSAWLVKRV